MNELVWRFSDHEDKEPLHYTACGLDDVYLMSGYDPVEMPDGEGDGIRIRNLEGLHEAIGDYLAAHKKVLSGKELRYLRNHMDLTQSELGALVGLSSQQVARWEKETNKPSGAAESLVRVLFLENLCDNFNVRDLLNGLETLDDEVDDRTVFAETMDGWRALAA